MNPSIKLPVIFTVRVPNGKVGSRLFRYLDTSNLDTAPINPPSPVYNTFSIYKNSYCNKIIKGGIEINPYIIIFSNYSSAKYYF